MISQLSKVILLSSTFLFFSFNGKENVHFAKTKTTYVYICITKNSYAYHLDYECRGMKQCKGEKRKVTLEDAKGKYERKLCGWEK